MAEWVQSKYSKDGERWELDDSAWRNKDAKCSEWVIRAKDSTGCHFIPRSEYALCAPPERWERVEATIMMKREEVLRGINLRGVHLHVDQASIGVIRFNKANTYRVVSVVLERKVE